MLVDLLRGRENFAPTEQVVRDLAASTSISWSRARNTVVKLIDYGIVFRRDSHLIRLAVGEGGDPENLIADRVASELIERLVKEKAWSCMRLDLTTGAITIDSMTLPSMSDGLAMWATEFGVAARDRTEARYWEVAERHRSAFLSGARRANNTKPKRAKSAETLAAELARQAENGRVAEEWVLQYERKRLRDHPFNNQIRRVSEDDVAAGYDIISFATQSSLQHDLFIEVKSYGTTKVFHWSRNEIATAREFGEDYALYLVDRTKMDDSTYEPHVITAPSPEMFGQLGSGWKVEATSFEHIAIQT